MHEFSPHLDGQYAAFGKILEGFDELDRIADVATDRRDRPREEQIMVSVTADLREYVAPESEN